MEQLPALTPDDGYQMLALPEDPTWRKAMVAIGLKHPNQRTLVFGVVASVFLFALEPEFAFYNGRARPWTLLADPDSEAPPTQVPWYLAAAAAAFFGRCI